MAATPGPRKSTRERREQRTERILDVTSDLVLRWGYRKTTLDDIARESDVAKGTLFLHWRNRDALFTSLLRRERVRLYDGLLDELTDPSMTMEAFFVRLIDEILRRPIIRAVMVGDEETLGRLVGQKRTSSTTAHTRREFVEYLQRLQQLGLVRTDLDLAELQALCTSTFLGFLFAALRMPPMSEGVMAIPDERRCAELCGQSVARLLRPAGRTAETDAEGETLAETSRLFLRQARVVAHDGYQDSLRGGRGS